MERTTAVVESEGTFMVVEVMSVVVGMIVVPDELLEEALTAAADAEVLLLVLEAVDVEVVLGVGEVQL